MERNGRNIFASAENNYKDFLNRFSRIKYESPVVKNYKSAIYME